MTNITDAPEGGKSAIRKAITAVAKGVTRVSKNSRNDEQKYDFASIDDFLAMTGPIMAENGLFIMIDEEEVTDFERQGKYNPSFWLRIKFLITVCHENGEEMKPVRRTVEVIRTGAQSFGSAQSYVLKQFQRALFNIPTGDKDDADFAERGDGPAVKTPEPLILSSEELMAAQKRIEDAPDLSALKTVFTEAFKATDDKRQREILTTAKDDRKAELEAPAKGNEAPAEANPFDGAQS